jgi:hypothetical protein
MGKAEALRAAQSDLRRDGTHPQWAHPFYWAAFILMGDPGEVGRPSGASGARPAWMPWAAGGAAAVMLAAVGLGAALSCRRRRDRSGG